MSSKKSSKSFEVPANWDQMSEKERDAWVERALTEIGPKPK